MNGRVRILHVTDTHLRSSPLPDSYAGYPDARSRLQAALSRVREHQTGLLDAVILSGDVCDDGSTSAALEVRGLLEEFGAPIIAIAGNHDDPAVIREVFGTPDVDIGAWRIIGTDTTRGGEVGGAVDVTAVMSALDARADRPNTLLVTHHPPRSTSTHEWFRLEGAAQLLDELRRRPHVRAVLSGHTHQRLDTTDGDLRLIVGTSTWYTLRHDDDTWAKDDASPGVQIIELGERGSITLRPIDTEQR